VSGVAKPEFARAVGVRHALALNSATAGLHLALEALGVGPGSIVLTTPFTFAATAEVARYLGADPVFVDIDPATLNLDPRGVEAALDKARSAGSLHLMTYYRDRYGLKPADFPAALECSRTCISLPLSAALSDDDIERVVSAVTDIGTTFRR
jgi:dTDP-4-amino-4,6-dideoxygalactose transaminase